MWLRFYTEVLNDPKVQLLTPDQFKGWVNLLCLAKEHDGVLPSLRDMAFRLRTTEAEMQGLCNDLTAEGLLDYTELGWKPHNWEGRQYDTNSAAERMRRHRQKKRDVTVTPPVTPSDERVTSPLRHRDAVDTESDTETEQNTETETEPCADAPVVSASPEVGSAFTYWQTVLNHPTAKLTPKRKKLIQARLQDGYTLVDIKKAIDGCRASPFHMGQNEGGTVYDDIELICRNGEKLESFISRSNGNGRTQVTHKETHNERAARETDELIRRSLAAAGVVDNPDSADTGEAWIAADFQRL